jgi:N-acetylglucosamine-6-phosphate deacetylase
MELVGRRHDNGQPVCVEVHDGVIISIRGWRATEASLLPWISPGLIDLQVNGHGGRDFVDPDLTAQDIEQISLGMDPDGVVGYLPTVTTQGHDTLRRSLATIATAMRDLEAVRSRALGIHLEGPFISSKDGPRGAHPQEHSRPPNWDEFQELQAAAAGSIRILTMSPEYEGASEFIRQVVDDGVVVAIGHTAANSDQIRAAVDAGARMSTHLGNGAHNLIHRHPNYIWDQLAEDRLTASLIADGYHLPPPVIKSIVRAKTPERLILVSDITGMAGAGQWPPGRYEGTGLGAIEVLEDGRVVVAGQHEYLAGATLPLTVGIANVVKYAQIDLAAAIEMASARPANLIGFSGVSFETGAAANLIQFQFPENGERLEIVATIKAGCVVHGEPVTVE